jgi:hypothetical protein
LLSPPAGTGKPCSPEEVAMNWRPRTKCVGSPTAAAPIVPVIRPCRKSGSFQFRLTPSTLNLTDSRPVGAAARSAVRNGEPETSLHSMSCRIDWYMAAAELSPPPEPIERVQMSMNPTCMNDPRSRFAPVVSQMRISSPQIWETSCCSGSRSTSLAGGRRSESDTR